MYSRGAALNLHLTLRRRFKGRERAAIEHTRPYLPNHVERYPELRAAHLERLRDTARAAARSAVPCGALAPLCVAQRRNLNAGVNCQVALRPHADCRP